MLRASRFCRDLPAVALGYWRSRARRSVLQHIERLWPGESGALMQAALIGGRAFFGREIKSDFQRTGTYHILVVSGINVGILAFAVFWLLRSLPFGETWATVLTILLSWGYAFVADLGAPIVRATITLSIYLLTRLLYRDRAGLNALGIAALGILLVNPRTLFEASFQLTFLAVIAVAGIAVPILRRTIYPLQAGLRNLDSPEWDYSQPTRAAQFRVEMRLLRRALAECCRQTPCECHSGRSHSGPAGASELLFVSIVINLALALPMAWYFHRATTTALPANALMIPIASVLLPSAVLAVALSYCGRWLAFLPAKVAGYSLALLTGTVRFIGHYPHRRCARAHPDAGRLTVRRANHRARTALIKAALVRDRRNCRAAAFGGVDRTLPAQAAHALPASSRSRPSTSDRAIPCCSLRPKERRCCSTPAACRARRIRTSMSAKKWSRRIYGRAAFAGSMPSLSRTPTAITWAECARVITNFQPREFWYGVESPDRGFQELEQIGARVPCAHSSLIRPATASTLAGCTFAS